ncbi:MAG: CcmD family protein [Armatimonadetes bacterium]|nr:CcmD family protein [Armatimonadota bacterium]NCO95965.1 CcmD family protein [Armatimonadota bacterium]NCP33907.1 CcmD family protein [Armatimonadota bacterium]NCQ29541.1 CcmD family protein [Armatimonadota bacterium]NDK13467.1 CcmD family protein [Armatimonadota bacterium]
MIPVAVVSLIVWVGLFAYLWTLSRQVEALKRKLEKPE